MITPARINDISNEIATIYAHISDELRAVQRKRPAWDVALLTQAGFRDIQVDTAVSPRVYREIDRFYNPTPMFCVTACR